METGDPATFDVDAAMRDLSAATHRGLTYREFNAAVAAIEARLALIPGHWVWDARSRRWGDPEESN